MSRSHPAADASKALDQCLITDTTGRTGTNGPLGIDIVVGMGLVPRAKDVALYVAIAPETTELRSDSPTWVIATRGQIGLALDPDISVDPVCFIVDGIEYWSPTGGLIHDGKLVTPRPLKTQPIYQLPPLAP